MEPKVGIYIKHKGHMTLRIIRDLGVTAAYSLEGNTKSHGSHENGCHHCTTNVSLLFFVHFTAHIEPQIPLRFHSCIPRMSYCQSKTAIKILAHFKQLINLARCRVYWSDIQYLTVHKPVKHFCSWQCTMMVYLKWVDTPTRSVVLVFGPSGFHFTLVEGNKLPLCPWLWNGKTRFNWHL